MLLFVARRLLQAAMTMLIISVMIFGLARLTGDPTPLVVQADSTEADRDFFRQQYGLDRPVVEQYLIFIGNVLQGDLGTSFRHRQPALDMVLAALWPTLQLTLAAMALAILIGVPLGMLAARHRGKLIDRVVDVYSSIGLAVPSFWLALMLIILFSIMIPVLPSTGYGSPANYVLPTVTLAFFASASVIRLTRANMVEALRSDFVYMQRILGLSTARIVIKHALRNASLPIVTYLGLQFGLLLGGAIVTERVFAWPGIGQTIVDAIFSRDYPLIQAAVLVTALFFILINVAVDMLYMVLDPRVRTS